MCKTNKYSPVYSDLMFESLKEAKNVLHLMHENINEYGFVTIADMYDLADAQAPYTAHRFGWDDLSGFKIITSYSIGRYILITNRNTIRLTNVFCEPADMLHENEDTSDMRLADAQVNLEEVIEDLIKQGHHYSDPIVVKLRETYDLLNK